MKYKTCVIDVYNPQSAHYWSI